MLGIRGASSSGVLRRAFTSSSKSSAGFGLAPRRKDEVDEPGPSHRPFEPRSPEAESSIAPRNRLRDGSIRTLEPWNDPDVPEELRYRPPPLPPSNVEHPSARKGKIMDFRDKSATFPPHLAIQRIRKLKHAKDTGVDVNRLNRREHMPIPRPDVPVSLNIDRSAREKVAYTVGEGTATVEKRAYFQDQDVETGVEALDWAEAEVAVDTPGVEIGRVVESRRSGKWTVGIILASILTGDRKRLLVLRPYGDIWPITSTDITFTMPLSLIDPALVEACWTPEILELWAKGETESLLGDKVNDMLEARRKVASILRRITRETERMCCQMMVGSVGKRGIEGLWEKIAPQDENARAAVTAIDAAQYLLSEAAKPPVDIKPQTLPAFAAHSLMMRRPDLFLADPNKMMDSQTFMVRSRSERTRLAEVDRLLSSKSVEDQAIVQAFVEKAKSHKVFSTNLQRNGSQSQSYISHEHDLPKWTSIERDIIWTLLMSLYETRSLQVSNATSIISNLMKFMDLPPDTLLDRGVVGPFCVEIGIIPPWETLRSSEYLEDVARAKASFPTTRLVQGDLLKGDEMDSLREDFTHHKVYVIDDAGAAELDDGVSLERVPDSDESWLHVHVADPTRYIHPNHPVAIEAMYRGSAQYLHERNTPLLPEELTMGKIHLGATTREGQPQAVMTFSARVSPSAQILETKVRLGWVKPSVITYEAVDEALGHHSQHSLLHPLGRYVKQKDSATSTPSLSQDEVADLRQLQKLAGAFRNERLKSHGFHISHLSANLSLLNRPPASSHSFYDPTQIPARSTFWTGNPIIDFNVKKGHQTPATDSHEIVAELMLVAGRVGAEFCSSRQIPIAFRKSDRPKIVDMPGWASITIDELLAKRDPTTFTLNPSDEARATIAYASSEVNTSPGPHWMLGFTDNSGYARFTSPLRRFDDLLAHWQIKAFLAEQASMDKSIAPGLTREEAEEAIRISFTAQRNATTASTVNDDWWKSHLLISRKADPRPQGFEFGEESVDLAGPLEGVVAGRSQFSPSGNTTNTRINIPSLGITGRLLGTEALELDTRFNVVFDNIIQWPNPLVSVTKA